MFTPEAWGFPWWSTLHKLHGRRPTGKVVALYGVAAAARGVPPDMMLMLALQMQYCLLN
jgi:hypothetical protein